MMPCLLTAAFFAAVAFLSYLVETDMAAALIVAGVSAFALMVLYFYLGRSTVLIAVHADDSEVS